MSEHLPPTLFGLSFTSINLPKLKPADRWFIAAYEATPKAEIHEGTYEAIGLHFNSNRYNLDKDILVRHGEDIVEVERTFEGIGKYLEEHNIEGLVFWKDGYPACKIKRSDFGFAWPIKKDDE